ncbi:MAG: methyl-accepting chemotaxis protein [Acetobacteraceae bacterium]|jgi:methyl-accepting chemotaxis protein
MLDIFANFKVRTKLSLLLGLSALALIVSIGVAASMIRQRMIDDRVDKLRAVVRSSIGIAQSLENRVAAKQLTQEQALAMLRDDVHAMRFDAGEGYVIIVADPVDGRAMVLAHGTDPSREGKAATAMGTDGRSMSDMIHDALNGHDSGVISLMFPRPGQTVPLPKVSYVTRFEPLNAVFLAGAYTDDLTAAFHATLWHLATIGGLILLATILATWLIGRDITRSLGALRSAMERLAHREFATNIPGADRRDEIGAMAATVRVFKDSMIETEHLREDQETQKQQAERERRQAMLGLAARFEATVGGIVEGVASAATGLQSTAQSMSETSEETTRQSTTVAAASEQASRNVQTVASATEELASSIREISQQVAQASGMIQHGVQEATRSNEQVQGLTASAEKIGDVVKIISGIAAQTNLLALNATIEAARAGDAGKGFAVVASEVKALANQTAKATDEIAAQIKAIQEATQISAQSIQSVAETIGKVNATAAAIAAAVEEQGAATQEISRNVVQAAQGTQEVSGSIAGVSEAAQQTGAAAVQVLASAGALSQNGEALKAQVAAFLQEVRAA